LNCLVNENDARSAPKPTNRLSARTTSLYSARSLDS
jgi:hypothetical protein